MSPEPPTAAPRPIEVILSCTCCQRTIADVYQYAEADKGFRHDTDNTTAQPVPKLWMTECAHLICSDHLNGGGVPFHPEGTVPKVACPHCIKYGDDAPKELYYIRGLSKGQYDKQIPKEYFSTPPIHFDGKSNGMNALSFHYRQLIHFGTNILVKYNQTKQLADRHKEKAKTAEKSAQDARQQVDTLSKRVAQLDQCERELKPWKEREGKITHYLNTFTKVMAENDKLREQLDALGYAVPKRTWSIDSRSGRLSPSPPQEPKTTQSRIVPRHPEVSKERSQAQLETHNEDEAISYPHQNPSSSRILSGPSEPLRNLYTIHQTVDQIQPSRKRQAEGEGGNERQVKSPRLERPNSRQLMPPPPHRPMFKKPPPTPLGFLDTSGRQQQSKAPDNVHISEGAPNSAQVSHIGRPQVRHLSPQDIHEDVDADMNQGEPNDGIRPENIYWNQRSSPLKRLSNIQPTKIHMHREGLIADPRIPQYDPAPSRQALSPRSSNIQTTRPDLDYSNQFAQHMLPRHSSRYGNDNYNHFQNNQIHSDPGSLVLSDNHIQAQRLSDPSLQMPPPPSTRRNAIPRGKLNDITSPFFSANAQSRVAPSRQKLTLPSRVKTGSSVSQYDINHLSFINKPHNPSNHQPIGPGTGYSTTASSYIPSISKPAVVQRHSNTSAFIQRPGGGGLANSARAETRSRSKVMTPFKPPTFQRRPLLHNQGYHQQGQGQGQGRGNYYMQQQQEYDAGNQFTQLMTPSRQQGHHSQYMHGTPMLLPSRAGNGTGMSGQRW